MHSLCTQTRWKLGTGENASSHNRNDFGKLEPIDGFDLDSTFGTLASRACASRGFVHRKNLSGRAQRRKVNKLLSGDILLLTNHDGRNIQHDAVGSSNCSATETLGISIRRRTLLPWVGQAIYVSGAT